MRSRLWDYRIDEVRLDNSYRQPRPRIVVVYSVLPFMPESDRWFAGNGTTEGLWVARKWLFVEIVRDGDRYRIGKAYMGGSAGSRRELHLSIRHPALI